MTLHATFPATGLTAATGGRRISGTAVPWGEIGTVSDGRRVRFLPGSLDAAGRPPVLRDHDPQRPIGRVTDARDTGHGIEVDTTISATVNGDEALTLASDGILAAWSVGVDPTDTRPGDDGVLEVVAGNWRELSLLTFGAFAGAQVVDVAATEGPPDTDEDEEVEETEEEEPDPEEEPVSTTQLEPVHAGTVPAVPIVGPPPKPTPDLSHVSRLMASMAKAPAAEINAALADITTATGSGGQVVRPAFQASISNLIEFGRPTINAISHAPLPPNGMRVEWPQWTVLPDVGVQATQKTEITSVAATIGVAGTDVITWAGGNDVSLQLAERSSPSFLEEWVKAASEIYARKTNGYVITTLLAAAEVVAPPATLTFLNSIAALIAGFDPLTVPNGRMFVAISYDVWAVMIGVPATNGPAYWEGSINFGSQLGEVSAGGLNIFVDRQLPAKTMLAGVSSGATWYEDPSAPASLRVIDVALLGVNIAVYGFGALGLNWAGTPNPAFEKMTFTTLPTSFATGETGTKK